jgi:hypothetical protein
LDTRLDTEEPKTTALQTLTATHTENIATNTNNIASLDVDLFTEQQKTTALQTLTEGHTTDLATNTANILTKQPLITSSTDLECNSITTSSETGSLSSISGFGITRFNSNIILLYSALDDVSLLAYNKQTGICSLQSPSQLDFKVNSTTKINATSSGVKVGASTSATEALDVAGNILASGSITANNLTASSAIVNSVDIGSGFSSLQTQVDALIEYITNVGFRVFRPNTDLFNSISILEYNTIDFDTENGFSLVDFKYTISLAGTYLFTLQVFVPSSVEMTVDIVRERAGVDTILQQISNGTAVASNNSSYNITTISQVLTGDKIFGRVSSGSVRLSTSTSPANASFSGSRLSS